MQLSQTKKRYFAARQKQRRQQQLGIVDELEPAPLPPMPTLGGDTQALLQTGAVGGGDAHAAGPAHEPDAPPDEP